MADKTFTFSQFMQATGHLDKPLGEQQVLLHGNGITPKHFYTKEQAKEYAQKNYENPLKWYKSTKKKIIYAIDEKTENRVWEIQLFA